MTAQEKAYKDYARACYLMGAIEAYKVSLNILLSIESDEYIAKKANTIDTEIISMKHQLQQLADKNINNPLFKKVKW